MRVLVTGASGNTGTALLRRLQRETAVDEIVGVCRHPPRTGPATSAERVRWVAADVATDDLAPAISGVEAVVHLAWLIRPSHDRQVLDRVNVLGTERLLAAAAAAGTRVLVVASSIAAYAPGPGRLVDESWPVDGLPSSLYSWQKVAVEHRLDAFERAHPDVRVVRMRPVAICQRDAASQIVRHFLGPFVPRSLLKRSLLPVLPWPDGLTVQAAHADDVADAYTAALTREIRGAFNLAAEPVLDGEQLARILRARMVHMPMPRIRAVADLAWRLRLQPTDPAWLDLLCNAPQLDAARARAELAWAPRYSSTDAVRELFEGMESQAAGPTPSLARTRGTDT
jgi:UDP-glucose 4-epimerase